MNKDLKIAILLKFDSQSDFAQCIGMSEALISRVIHERRKLSDKEAREWEKVLNCDASLLNSIPKS